MTLYGMERLCCWQQQRSSSFLGYLQKLLILTASMSSQLVSCMTARQEGHLVRWQSNSRNQQRRLIPLDSC